MIINTCSSAISFARELENASAGFYELLSQKYPQDADLFNSFAGENRKFIKEVERTYYGVISDAIEGCFAFNISADEYTFNSELDDKSNTNHLAQAVEIEEKIIKFYSDAADQSKMLMADVPRAFTKVVKKRNARLLQLQEQSTDVRSNSESSGR